MIKRGLSLGSSLAAYGGEALLIPKPDLEKIFAASFDQYGRAGIQTNGDLIDAQHIALFNKYSVGVGVSCDGPGELNSLRPRRRDGNWQEPTEQTLTNLKRLRDANISVSIITTLHKENGTAERLPILKAWGLELAAMGITYVNVHPLETESLLIKAQYALNAEQEIAAWLDLAYFVEAHAHLKWVPFDSMKQLLLGKGEDTNCVWHHCDPLTTPAVQAVLGDGSLTNCGRIAKEGVPWVKANQQGYERYISLYQTPQRYGGCKDCRFFLFCGGECPGSSETSNGSTPDWRLKTDHCSTLMGLFEFYEERLYKAGRAPLSLSPKRIGMEKTLMRLFANGSRPNSLIQLEKMSASGALTLGSDHGDVAHVDSPHQDSHGDHSDLANNKRIARTIRPLNVNN